MKEIKKMLDEFATTEPYLELPLAGLTIVELGHSVAAPFGGQILASMGATVLKVEAPEKGDDARSWGPPFWHGAAALFQSLNREKLTACIDLKDPEELAALRRFILEHADAVLQNMRPGLVERFGIGGELVQEKPSLIYCNVGAFGNIGPLAGRPGYDPLMQAFGGIMSITGEEGQAPVRVGPSIIDMATGMWAAIGILAAVRKRNIDGKGCVVDTSLFETALAWMTVPSALYLASGKVPKRTGSEAAMLAPYKAFKAADGYLIVAAGNDNLFNRLTGALNRPDLVSDPRFRTNSDRVAHREELNALIGDIISGRTRAEWIERIEAAGVPCAPLQDTAEVLGHPQTKALGMLQESPDGKFNIMGLPLRFGGRRPPFRRSPPSLDQHGERYRQVLNGKDA